MDEDVYFHKTITYRTRNHNLRFRTSQELFSSHEIDTGTKFLLRTINEAGYDGLNRILDLGCGYGPIGLTLKNLYRDSTVHMVDRDALAIEYTLQNAELNGLNDVEIYGSLGYDDVKRDDFDLIVSNIPGKAGEIVIACLIRDVRYYLAPGGVVAMVVVAPLEETVSQILEDTPDIEIIFRRNRSGHAVFHYRFTGESIIPRPEPNALERGVYHRKDVEIHRGKLKYTMQTAYGLPEFDSPGYSTEMLIKALYDLSVKDIHRAVVFNPGQGHAPVALWKLIRPETIELIDRDLLALRYSRLNLVNNGCPTGQVSIFHQAGVDSPLEDKIDLITGVLREKEGKNATLLMLRQTAAMLSDDGLIIIVASSTAITRLVAYIEAQKLLVIKKRERRRGNSLLVLGHI